MNAVHKPLKLEKSDIYTLKSNSPGANAGAVVSSRLYRG
jgi:hypothetical protein